MNHVIILVAVTAHYVFAFNNTNDAFCVTPTIPDYYWREFRGAIPYDAIVGGLDKTGKPIFIGQVLVNTRGLFPANIYMGKDQAVFALNKKIQYADAHVKVLCGRHPEKFKWIVADAEKIQLITQCQSVLGGVDGDQWLNIGRVNYNDEVIVGRTYRKPSANSGLWVHCRQGEQKFDIYEVLVYDCKIALDVDVRFGNSE